MASIFTIYLIHQIALTIGLSSSLIADIFIIIVEKTKHIRGIEKKTLDRVLSYSFISSVIVFIVQIVYLFFIIVTDPVASYSSFIQGFSIVTAVISACLLCTAASQKYYQIKMLYRYQEKHQHLSNTFIEHHQELRYTAILSVTLWIALYICYLVV
jgi:hypothetical protein